MATTKTTIAEVAAPVVCGAAGLCGHRHRDHSRRYPKALLPNHRPARLGQSLV